MIGDPLKVPSGILSLLPFQLHADISRNGPILGNRYGAPLAPNPGMPRCKLIGSRRHICHLKSPFGVGHRKIRMIEYMDIGSHVRVQIAADIHHSYCCKRFRDAR